MPRNVEFKARVSNLDHLESRFLELNPRFQGEDHQIDTYFFTPNGRLKLRQGNIENSLIFYQRENIAGAKQSDVHLFHTSSESGLKDLLTAALGSKVEVDKTRRIYFIDNVKFHFDQVLHLGSFIEVEAIDSDGSISLEKLHEQASFYQNFFSITPADFISHSYSDLVVEKSSVSNHQLA